MTVAVPLPPLLTMEKVSGLPSGSVAASVPEAAVSSLVAKVPLVATGARLPGPLTVIVTVAGLDVAPRMSFTV